MRKRGLLPPVLILAMGIAFVGCDKKDDNNKHNIAGPGGNDNGVTYDTTLVGTWNLIMSFVNGERLPDEFLPDLSITVNGDGSGSGVEDGEQFTFSWSTNGSNLTVIDEDSTVITAVYSVNGDTLAMAYTDTWDDSTGGEIEVEVVDYYLKDAAGGPDDPYHDPDLVDTWLMIEPITCPAQPPFILSFSISCDKEVWSCKCLTVFLFTGCLQAVSIRGRSTKTSHFLCIMILICLRSFFGIIFGRMLVVCLRSLLGL